MDRYSCVTLVHVAHFSIEAIHCRLASLCVFIFKEETKQVRESDFRCRREEA